MLGVAVCGLTQAEWMASWLELAIRAAIGWVHYQAAQACDGRIYLAPYLYIAHGVELDHLIAEGTGCEWQRRTASCWAHCA